MWQISLPLKVSDSANSSVEVIMIGWFRKQSKLVRILITLSILLNVILTAFLAWQLWINSGTYCIRFISDDPGTPDNMQVAAGAQMLHGWIEKNCGTAPITAADFQATSFYRISGALSQPIPIQSTSILADGIPIPAILPGQEGEIRMDFTAPVQPGTYEELLTLRKGNGLGITSHEAALTMKFIVTK